MLAARLLPRKSGYTLTNLGKPLKALLLESTGSVRANSRRSNCDSWVEDNMMIGNGGSRRWMESKRKMRARMALQAVGT